MKENKTIFTVDMNFSFSIAKKKKHLYSVYKSKLL